MAEFDMRGNITVNVAIEGFVQSGDANVSTTITDASNQILSQATATYPASSFNGRDGDTAEFHQNDVYIPADTDVTLTATLLWGERQLTSSVHTNLTDAHKTDIASVSFNRFPVVIQGETIEARVRIRNHSGDVMESVTGYLFPGNGTSIYEGGTDDQSYTFDEDQDNSYPVDGMNEEEWIASSVLIPIQETRPKFEFLNLWITVARTLEGDVASQSKCAIIQLDENTRNQTHFNLPAAVANVTAAVTGALVTITVNDPITGSPVPDAEVVVMERGDALAERAADFITTDDNGQFSATMSATEFTLCVFYEDANLEWQYVTYHF